MPKYTWDATARRYRDSRGVFVGGEVVRNLVYEATDAARVEAAQLCALYLAGDISLDAWRTEMRTLIKTQQTAAAVAVVGGFAQVSQSDWGYIGRQTRTLYTMLDGIVADVRAAEHGLQDLPTRLTAQAMSYATGGRVTYNGMMRRREAGAGMNEERRMLGPVVTQHCPDCIAYADRGWQPIGTIPAIGDSICTWNCHCHLVFRKSKARATFSSAFATGAGIGVDTTQERMHARAAIDISA